MDFLKSKDRDLMITLILYDAKSQKNTLIKI